MEVDGLVVTRNHNPLRWVLNLVSYIYMWVPLANCLNDGPIIDKMPSKVPMTWRSALSCSFHDRLDT
ncbi:unnamed protein product [Sphagnum compactum]